MGSGERPFEGVRDTGGSAPASIEAMGSNANVVADEEVHDAAKGPGAREDVPGGNVGVPTPQSIPPETRPKSPMDFEELKQGTEGFHFGLEILRWFLLQPACLRALARSPSCLSCLRSASFM